MNKYEFITEIMELFDAMDTLKRDNKDLRNAIDSRIGESIDSSTGLVVDNDDFATYDYFALKKGRDEIFNDSVYSWNELSAWRNDAGEIEVISFDDWASEKVSCVPDYMRKKDFADYFAEELKELYAEEKADAISRLEASEAKGSGE